MPTPADREIRATFDDNTIVAYQAYGADITAATLASGRFVPPFLLDRMTWIKPLFLRMMYRSGWATKADQEHVFAIRISRSGFDWALEHCCLSSFEPDIYTNRETWAAQRTPPRSGCNGTLNAISTSRHCPG